MKHNIKFLCTILCAGLAFCLAIPLVNSIFIAYAESEAIVQDVNFLVGQTYNATVLLIVKPKLLQAIKRFT